MFFKKNKLGAKALAIITWYRRDKKKFNDKKKLQLLNDWIKRCASLEEYEISSALLHEKHLLSRSIRLAKIGPRPKLKTIKLFFILNYRKFKRHFL